MLEAVNVHKVFFQLCMYIESFVGTELYTVVICYITSPFYIRVCAQLLIMILFVSNQYGVLGRRGTSVAENERLSEYLYCVKIFRACSHGGGGPREGEVPHLPGVRKKQAFKCNPGALG